MPRAKSSGRTQWRTPAVVFFALFGLLLLWAAGKILAPFVNALIFAATLVILTFPLYRKLRVKLHGRNGLATSIMLLGITLVILIPAFVLLLLLLQQASGLFNKVQAADVQRTMASMNIPGKLEWVRHYVPSFDPASISPERLLLPVAKAAPAWVAAHGAAVLGGVAGAVVGFALTLLAAWFFYTEGESLVRELKRLSPLDDRYDEELFAKFDDVINATFRGQVSTALAQGAATGIGFAIAGVSGAIFWGAVAALMSLLPMVGAAAVWVPATIYLFIYASVNHTGLFPPIFLLVWGILVVSMIDNIVRPWAMKGRTEMPTVPLLFSILGGVQAFGFIGILLGPLVLALLVAVVDIYKKTFNRPGEDALDNDPE
jgi:predicted PurR-regulated permease PerM